MNSYTGEILDNRYEVGPLIGRGGMGVVYRARHLAIGRRVAVKFLNAEYATQRDVVTRFYREAQTAAAIGHKNIIDIYDVGISPRNEPYLVMEYLEGECLSALLERNGPVALAAACGILEPVLLALTAAHAKGVVHRDLKPENIFLVHDPTDGTIAVKLIDFGISKLTELPDGDKLTTEGLTLGTPAYMSPEQARGAEDIDHRSDIFSMGAILFELLTGDTPYKGASNREIIIKILTEAPRSPLEVHPDAPPEALPIIVRAMHRDPAERYQNAQEMLSALNGLSTFHERHTQLAECASGMTDRKCAVGDLGELAFDSSDAIPAEVLSHISKPGATPGGWSDSRGRSGAPVVARSRFPSILIATVAVMTLLGGALFFLVRDDETDTNGNDATSPARPLPPASPPPDVKETRPREVKITLNDVPHRSTILCDGVVVPTTTFMVPRSDTPMTLSVEAPGHTPFQTTLTPTEDLTVTVVTEPLETPKSSRRKRRAPGVDAKGERRGTRPSPGDDANFKGKRDAEIIRDFQ